MTDVVQTSKLIYLFNQTFGQSHQVELVRGEQEPVYLPADESHARNRIIFAHGFMSSAFHEIAHWLIAGKQRHKQIDYGYWYEADGRTALQQMLFEKVEVKPQAIEWILSKAANHKFRVSVDNLSGEATDPAPFKQEVYQQVKSYIKNGLPERAEKFRYQLCLFYGTSKVIQLNDFDVQSI